MKTLLLPNSPHMWMVTTPVTMGMVSYSVGSCDNRDLADVACVGCDYHE